MVRQCRTCEKNSSCVKNNSTCHNYKCHCKIRTMHVITLHGKYETHSLSLFFPMWVATIAPWLYAGTYKPNIFNILNSIIIYIYLQWPCTYYSCLISSYSFSFLHSVSLYAFTVSSGTTVCLLWRLFYSALSLW